MFGKKKKQKEIENEELNKKIFELSQRIEQSVNLDNYDESLRAESDEVASLEIVDNAESNIDNEEDIGEEHKEKKTKQKRKSLFNKINDLFVPKNQKNIENVSWEEPADLAQNDLGFELLREDGIMRVEDGLYARCIQFEDINYQGALYETQLEIHSQMNELYNSLPESCAIQLFMFTRKMHDQEMSEALHIPLTPVDDGYNELRSEQNRIVDLKMSQTAQNVKRIHCFVITCEELNMQRAKSVLDRACSGIERKLRDIESEHKILDGVEWLTLINHVTNPDQEEGIISYDDLTAMLGATAKDLIAPPNITTYGYRGISMGDYFYRILYISKYSNTVRDDFFSQLAEMPYNSIISMHAKPYDHADAVDLVDSKKTDLNMQKKQYIRKNPSAAYQDEELLPGNLGEQLENARETRTDLIQREQSMFDQTIVITLFSKSESELEDAYSEVRRITKGFNYGVSPLRDMQILGLKSVLPVGNNNVPISRAVLTDALSNFVPFTSDELMQKHGLFGGINQLSKNIISYDRTKAIAPNGFILGKTGRGKSVHAKYQILQLLCQDPLAKCIVLDPEGEYGGLCKLLPNSQHIKITNGGDIHINPLDITETYSDDGNPLSFKADFIVSLVDMMTGGMSVEQLNVLDRCANRIYDEYFRTKSSKDIPTLQTLYDELKNQPEEYAHALAVNIERYVKGSMNVFNAHTNVELNARLVVFDTKELQKNMSPVALLILLDQVWNFITSGRSQGTHTWFYVDEMQLLQDNEYAISYLDKLFTRARKWGAIPTGITQNVERVLKIDQFRYMIANSDYIVILGQSKTDTNALGDVLRLSDEQKKAVRTAGIGEGILLANGKVLQFENLIPKTIGGKPSQIYRALTTKLEDLVEMGDIKQ